MKLSQLFIISAALYYSPLIHASAGASPAKPKASILCAEKNKHNYFIACAQCLSHISIKPGKRRHGYSLHDNMQPITASTAQAKPSRACAERNNHNYYRACDQCTFYIIVKR